MKYVGVVHTRTHRVLYSLYKSRELKRLPRWETRIQKCHILSGTGHKTIYSIILGGFIHTLTSRNHTTFTVASCYFFLGNRNYN